MKTCGQCTHWYKVKSIKDFGECEVPIPHWVIVALHDKIVHTKSKACDCFEEKEDERRSAALEE